MDSVAQKDNREINAKILDLYKEFLLKIRKVEQERDKQIAELYKEVDRQKAEKILKSIKQVSP